MKSAAMFDTNTLFFNDDINFTFIEPDTERLDILLTYVQNVDPEVFESIPKDDMHFIDSSHVLKLGSDLSYVFFSVFPRLVSGVIVHLHDIFWPFEYPVRWFYQGRAYNEAYVLRAFLQYNKVLKSFSSHHICITFIPIS